MEQPFFLVPQNEDDSSIDKWDITNDDIVAVLSSYGLKNPSSITIEWVISSEIPHFALKNVGKDNAKILQSLCELEGIELVTGHFVTVDNVIYTSSNEITKKEEPKKKEEEGGGGRGKEDKSVNNADKIVNIIQEKNLKRLMNFCSSVNPSELKDSSTLRPAVVLALVYQLGLCLPSKSNISVNGDNDKSEIKSVIAWLEVFTQPDYIKKFGVKALKVFCDVVVPVLNKRIPFSSNIDKVSSNVKDLIETNSKIVLMDINDI